MQTEEITWKVVNNTVEKRMVDFSLIHKLVPCRKVRRRTKVMNVHMRKMQGVRSYSQYIKMKTSILRNMSDDSETDDSECFTDDDYSILYKSDVSLTKYMMDMSRKSVSYLCEEDDSPNKENNTSNTSNRTSDTPKRSSMRINTSKTASKKSNTSKTASKRNNTFNTSNRKNNTSNTSNKRNDTEKKKSNKSDAVNENDDTSNTESEENISSIVRRKVNSRSYKSKSPDAIGWRRVVKKKPSENASISTDTSGKTKLILDNSFFFPVHDEAEDDDLRLVVSEQSFETHSEKSHLSEENNVSGNKACTANEMLESRDETTEVNEITHNIITGQGIKDEEHKSVEQPILSAAETDEEMKSPSNEQSRLNENCSQEMHGSQNSPENVKRNLMSTFKDENTMQNFEGPSVSTNISTVEARMDCLNRSSNDGRTSENEDKDEMIFEMQPLFNGNVNQPRDSGIDEDTEEESVENGKKIRRKIKEEVEETRENCQSTSSTLEHENNSAVEIKSSLLNNDNTDDLNNNENVVSSPFKEEESTEEDKTDQRDRTVRQKSQPRVTCTEIVNKKYRIVPREASLSDDCTNLETNVRHFSDEEALEIVETSQYMDDSVSPLTKKRLQQLRRLNLTADSESSLGEDDDDDSYCTKENMRNKLLKRSKESSDASSSEDENSNFGRVMSVEFAEKEIRHKKFRRANYKEEESPCSSTMHKRKKKSDSNNLSDCTFKSPSKNGSFKTITNDKNTLENFFKGTTSCSDGEDNFKSFGIRNFDPHKSNHLNGIENRNFDENGDEKESDTNNLESGTKTESTNKKSRILRPSNLQEFIEEENLVHDTTISSFKFKDIQDEDDVFILDIPSAVLERELVGKRIVLTENKLKLGKEKYKVTFRDVDHISCVFGTGKSRKPYKTVNVKPVARVVANQKIIKSPKRSNQHTSDAVSYTNGKSEIEIDVCLSEKRQKKKRDTLLKEER